MPEERMILFAFDKISDFVPARYSHFLDKFTWLSLKIHGEGDKIYGRRKGIWYTRDAILAMPEHPYGLKFHGIMSQIRRTTDPKACWNWTGLVDGDGYPLVPCTMQRHSFSANPAHHLLYKLVFGYRPEKLRMSCLNILCLRPSHMKEEKYCVGETPETL